MPNAFLIDVPQRVLAQLALKCAVSAVFCSLSPTLALSQQVEGAPAIQLSSGAQVALGADDLTYVVPSFAPNQGGSAISLSLPTETSGQLVAIVSEASNAEAVFLLCGGPAAPLVWYREDDLPRGRVNLLVPDWAIAIGMASVLKGERPCP